MYLKKSTQANTFVVQQNKNVMLKKTLVLLACIIAFSSMKANSQNLTLPQTEFSIATLDSLEMEVGSFKKFNIWVLRSKSFMRRKIKMDISSTLPEGVVLNFSTQQEYFDVCEASLSVNPVAKPGVYYVIISGTTSYKSKGHILKLKVLDSDVSVSSPKLDVR